MIQREFLRTSEVARMLGVSVSTLRRWRCRGEVPELRSIRVGGAVRYPARDLHEFIDRQLGGATDGAGARE
jgi:excisionase family DNA binding protein